MAQIVQDATRTCSELLLEFENNKFQVNSSKIDFILTEDNKDVYNITAPFLSDGKKFIAGRVEARDSEYSKLVFFETCNYSWKEINTQKLELQDPFIANIFGELVLGGVEVFDDTENLGHLNYRTVFYKGTSITDLKRFATGPDRMKDIRLCGLKDQRILVFTRPQGKVGGRGKIGYTFIHRLDELNSNTINKATILENQFVPKEWGGANELHLLNNGKIGVLSHIAQFDDLGNRHYYSSAFCFDPVTTNYSPMKIIAIRNNFKPGPSKRPDLLDVVFSGGIVRLGGGKAEIYCGVSDAESQMAIIEDPFTEYE